MTALRYLIDFACLSTLRYFVAFDDGLNSLDNEDDILYLITLSCRLKDEESLYAFKDQKLQYLKCYAF